MTEGARERWLFDDEHPPLAEVDGAIAAHYLVDEATTVRELAARATLDPSLAARVQANARELVVAIRAGQREAGVGSTLCSANTTYLPAKASC